MHGEKLVRGFVSQFSQFRQSFFSSRNSRSPHTASVGQIFEQVIFTVQSRLTGTVLRIKLVVQRLENPLLQNVSKVRPYFAKDETHARRLDIED
jgi:hypothetical protein